MTSPAKAPLVIYLYKEDRCPKCLYINPKGEKHFTCHNTIADKHGRTNPECPAGEYTIIAGFRVELWAQRYAKAQLTGHMKNLRVIQGKLDGLDEETVTQFWSQVNLNIAIALGGEIADEVTGEGEEAEEGGEEVAEEGQPGAENTLRLVTAADGQAEEEATEEADDAEAEADAPAQAAGEEDDWED